MRRVPGAVSADHLISMGVPRNDVITALIREIGVTRTEAECAWDYAVTKLDAAYPAQLMASVGALT
jgi:hypothetical protein